MKNIYYLIWVDGIVNSKDYKRKDPAWKFTLFIIITTCNALNLWAILLWLKLFEIFSFLIKIDMFPGTLLNGAAGFIVQFASPFILLNYFLIFYNDRYEKLIKKYSHKNGKLAMIYTMCSVSFGVISAILCGVLR